MRITNEDRGKIEEAVQQHIDLPEGLHIEDTMSDAQWLDAASTALTNIVLRSDDPLNTVVQIVGAMQQFFSMESLEEEEPRLTEYYAEEQRKVQARRAMYLQYMELQNLTTTDTKEDK